MTRVDWFDEKTHVPVIDEQVNKLSTFVDAMADGVIDSSELHKQQDSVVRSHEGGGKRLERSAARQGHAAPGGAERVQHHAPAA